MQNRSHKTIDDEQKIRPREYQIKLAEYSFDRNVIAFLNTGAGKTLISTLVIEQFAEELYLKAAQRKWCIFLVPTIPLVFQQSEYIKKVTNLKVGKYCGDNTSDWNKNDWQLEFEENQVLVMVHQIFLHVLRHAFFSITQCNLLIFDECHHTTKNHPYNRIMREFYKCDPIPPISTEDPFRRRQSRPRILGLTASPIINSNEEKGECKQLLKELEEQLDSRIVLANQQEVNLFVTLPREKICEYESSSEESTTLLPLCSSFQKLKELEADYKVCADLEHVVSELGLWFCNRLLNKMITELSTKIPRIMNLDNNQSTHSHLAQKLSFLQQLHSEIELLMNQYPNQVIHPKVKMLLLLLSHYWNSNDNNHEMRAILFVQRKTTALCLLELLEEVKNHSATSAQEAGTALLRAQLAAPLQPRPILPQQPRPPSPQPTIDGKSRLLSYCQQRKLPEPSFVVSFKGADHVRMSWCSVSADGCEYQGNETEAFKTKKEAEKHAASKLLEILEAREWKKQKLVHHESVFEKAEDYQIPINVDSIRADALTGHGSKDQWNFRTMDVETQQKKVEAFRNGGINMLISTSVGEEGLDIQPCNLVIQFDELESVKKYIQSRGRARHPKAHFVCMISPQSKGIELLEKAKNCEQAMREIIASYAQIDNESEDEENEKEFSEELQMTTREGAKLTLQSSKGLLNHYCQKLPSDVYCKLLPRYTEYYQGEMYLFELILPNNCPLEHKKIMGIPDRSKAQAKRLAAFHACKKLYEEGELDEHLRPVKFEPSQDLQLSDEPKPKPLECEMMVPSEFQARKKVLGEFYENLLHLAGNGVDVTYCLLTHTRLPALPPFQLANNITVRITSSSSPRRLDSDQVLKCIRFHQLLWDGVEKKSKNEIAENQKTCNIENSMERFFLVVPASQQGIHWAKIDWCLSNMDFPAPSQLSSELILLSPFSSDSLYCFMKQSELFPSSPFPFNKYTSFVDYYQRKHQHGITNQDTPLLQVYKLSRPKNLLISQPASSGEHSSTIFLVPEVCCIHPLPQSLFIPALNLPSILYRIETLLIANDMTNYLPTFKDTDLIRQAVTSKATLEKGNYERLETLGDSFLKFATSLQLFHLYPHQHEGFLTQIRSKFTSNNHLCKLGLEHNIPQHIINKQFGLDWWTWPNFAKEDRMKELPQNHFIKRKTIADCAEAILGAFYLSGEQAGWTLMRKWFPDMFDTQPPQLNEPPSLTPRQHTIVMEAQKPFQFEFKNPHILLQALTHASMSCSKRPEDYSMPCYQRLEFLGDAILDILITKYLFHKYPALEPGELTNLRACAVNSNAFSFLAYSQKLHQFIQRISPSLDKHIERYVSSVEENQGRYSEEYDSPKVLGDVLEAVTAAIYLDSGGSLDCVWTILQGVLEPFLEQYVTPDNAKNPIAEMMEWAAKQKELKVKWSKLEPAEEGERTVSMELRIYKEDDQAMNLNDNGEEDVLVVVGKASNKKVAKRRASLDALRNLKNKSTSMEISSVCYS